MKIIYWLFLFLAGLKKGRHFLFQEVTMKIDSIRSPPS